MEKKLVDSNLTHQLSELLFLKERKNETKLSSDITQKSSYANIQLSSVYIVVNHIQDELFDANDLINIPTGSNEYIFQSRKRKRERERRDNKLAQITLTIAGDFGYVLVYSFSEVPLPM